MDRLSEEDFRARLRGVLERTGLSMRQLSTAMGRDVGYVAALLDPARPSRARPTPADLAAASDAIGIPLAELLRDLWAVDPARLADELSRMGITPSLDERLARLGPRQRSLVLELIDALADPADGESAPR